MSRKMVCIDGNTAAAHVAHAVNEVIAIYPITPSSVMGEISDAKSAAGEKNIWGTVPKVVEMQSEGGAAGAVHGALQAGAMTTTFTASQGLLLMIPNMYKIAGELTSTVFHVSARAIAAQALSIFGDHSDVMACRQTGWTMFCSNNPQEVMDFALIAQATTLESRVPVLHFFDGFRTSHEVQKVEQLSQDDMRHMIDDELMVAHRQRGLSPDHPELRGTAQNPDVYFHGRETVNPYYEKVPGILQAQMDKFAKRVGRQYNLVDYVGDPNAERVVVMMGSGCDAMEELVLHLNAQGEKVGLIKIRLFLPFPIEQFCQALPASVKKITVLDRTKEPGSIGEPLYQAVRTAIGEGMVEGFTRFEGYPAIVGGRYGLGSFEFNAGMCKAVLDNMLADKPKNHFIVGFKDDLCNNSLEFDPNYLVPFDGYAAMFYGLGSDGTVGANKNSIKIIGDCTDHKVQAYFVYDSKKAGSMTTSHLRFGNREIRSTYLIQQADFVACHNFSFLEKYDMLKNAKDGATFLLNAPYGKDEIWAHLPKYVQQQIIDKGLKFYVIDGVHLGEKIGLGPRINVIMQTAFFKISGIIPETQAIQQIKDAIVKSYSKAGEKVVNMNKQAVDVALESIQEVTVPTVADSTIEMQIGKWDGTPEMVQKTLGKIIDGLGHELPLSAMPADGTFPTGTAAFEKRNIAVNIPVWDKEVCIQCGICSFVCPHATIRMKIYDESDLKGAPETFQSCAARGKDMDGKLFTLQVAPEDCTGCGACVHNCPAKSKTDEGRKAINMTFQAPLRDAEAKNWEFFLNLPDTDPALVNRGTLKGSQLLPPMFEFSGACAGCGETPFVKLCSQLFGDRMVVANATGCSSIYGGNLPTTPWTKRKDGLGPAWSNSLFEDNAEFGLGMRLAIDKTTGYARELLEKNIDCGCKACEGTADLKREILASAQDSQEEIEAQRGRVAQLRKILGACTHETAKPLLVNVDYLVKKSVWIHGGDGWAYDIGYGGLDHVLASGENVNVLVLDTEVYSNTGGQASKSTPTGAVALFAAGGKPMPKKDLGMIAMSYGNIYVAHIALSNPAQAVKAMIEAESFDGPSLILAYSHCIAHGINMTTAVDTCKEAVNCGHWPLFRFDPRLVEQGRNPLQLDSKDPSISFQDFAANQNRFRVLKKANPEQAEALLAQSAKDDATRYDLYKKLAAMQADCGKGE
ncbi:pyruvate:ferredoxin (flavodoxin) oxidoreductase [Geothermobacter hydrogeniphilus]|uniref:Pyruvate:ferredoxin oxidoreductase n=1 Tax=Geothermobacter hydrogeniphilus TaxID=1969733 RepID=A0A1X0Y8D7_9BACT|nr:pyruvate:ferredoxin (flavodoxin) oxidoreductase [Geothermobacter hydrogeniphilus]ORJ61294.1 pyruvate:ferredoxin (flavodoxin) oxidoreductase [Geothermobacter hydrogeniphilus]